MDLREFHIACNRHGSITMTCLSPSCRVHDRDCPAQRAIGKCDFCDPTGTEVRSWPQRLDQPTLSHMMQIATQHNATHPREGW